MIRFVIHCDPMGKFCSGVSGILRGLAHRTRGLNTLLVRDRRLSGKKINSLRTLGYIASRFFAGSIWALLRDCC
jgi:hypothetical protein